MLYPLSLSAPWYFPQLDPTVYNPFPVELTSCRIETKRPDLPPSLTTPALISLVPSAIPPQARDLVPGPQCSQRPGGYAMDAAAKYPKGVC